MCGGSTGSIYDHPLVEPSDLCLNCRREMKAEPGTLLQDKFGHTFIKTTAMKEPEWMKNHGSTSASFRTDCIVSLTVCELCTTSYGTIDIGVTGKPRMVCQGCCKRAFETLDKIKETVK